MVLRGMIVDSVVEGTTEEGLSLAFLASPAIAAFSGDHEKINVISLVSGFWSFPTKVSPLTSPSAFVVISRLVTSLDFHCSLRL